MSSMTVDAPTRKVIVGVDTHNHIHVAVAVEAHGAWIGDLTVSADTGGYTHLELAQPPPPAPRARPHPTAEFEDLHYRQPESRRCR